MHVVLYCIVRGVQEVKRAACSSSPSAQQAVQQAAAPHPRRRPSIALGTIASEEIAACKLSAVLANHVKRRLAAKAEGRLVERRVRRSAQLEVLDNRNAAKLTIINCMYGAPQRIKDASLGCGRKPRWHLEGEMLWAKMAQAQCAVRSNVRVEFKLSGGETRA
ncbi:hypothetical protein PENSPDRAFT_666405 [Peniophora sp. CONT]|nr:hypothetical protein PENSPDRAFT_666405 [Peniophora sp. CONT]